MLHAKLGNEKADKASIDRWTKQNLSPLFVRSSSGKTAVGSCEEVRFASASTLEGDGFEPSVPRQIRSRFESRSASHDGLTVSRPGIESSNPPPSTSESDANRPDRAHRLGDESQSHGEPVPASMSAEVGAASAVSVAGELMFQSGCPAGSAFQNMILSK